MLVDFNATRLVRMPANVNLCNHLTSGGVDLTNNARAVQNLTDLCRNALLEYRSNIGLDNCGIRFHLVNMENSTDRIAVGVLIEGEFLRSFYDTKNTDNLQMHIDATMCVVSWYHGISKRRSFGGLRGRVNLTQLPVFMPDILLDSPLYFTDATIFDYLTNPNYGEYKYQSFETCVQDIIVSLPKVATVLKDPNKVIRFSDTQAMTNFIFAYGRIINKLPVDYPPKVKLLDSWIKRTTSNLDKNFSQEQLRDMYSIVKRCFYRMAKEGVQCA